MAITLKNVILTSSIKRNEITEKIEKKKLNKIDDDEE